MLGHIRWFQSKNVVKQWSSAEAHTLQLNLGTITHEHGRCAEQEGATPERCEGSDAQQRDDEGLLPQAASIYHPLFTSKVDRVNILLCLMQTPSMVPEK